MSKQAPPVREILGFTFLHVREVARRTGLSRQHVALEIERGHMLAKVIAGCWYVRDVWLMAWLDTQDDLSPSSPLRARRRRARRAPASLSAPASPSAPTSPPVPAEEKGLSTEDQELRRIILAEGSLRGAAARLGWPYSRVTERLRRKKQKAWWRELKQRWSVERKKIRYLKDNAKRRAKTRARQAESPT